MSHELGAYPILIKGYRISHLQERFFSHHEKILNIFFGEPAQVAESEGFQSEHLARVYCKSALKAIIMQFEKIEFPVFRRFDRDYQVPLNFFIDNGIQSDLFSSPSYRILIAEISADAGT